MQGGAWRSLVAHLLWEQGVGGSNPLAPTTHYRVQSIRACSSARTEQRPPEPCVARSNRARRAK